jgi:hypothetical protein
VKILPYIDGKRDFADETKLRFLDREMFLDYPCGPDIIKSLKEGHRMSKPPVRIQPYCHFDFSPVKLFFGLLTSRTVR